MFPPLLVARPPAAPCVPGKSVDLDFIGLNVQNTPSFGPWSCVQFRMDRSIVVGQSLPQKYMLKEVSFDSPVLYHLAQPLPL